MAMQGPPPKQTPPPAIIRAAADVTAASNDWASYQIDNDTQRGHQRKELDAATRRNNRPTTGQG